jgi:hypothetical protein
MQTDYGTKNGLDFIHKVIAQETENECKILYFLSKFKVVAQKAASKFVYHINVIDELHTNENAHNRIRAKLLQ